MRISVEFDSLEEFTQCCIIGQKAEEPKMLFREPLTAEDAVKALNAAAAEAVEDKADSSEDKPKKAKATKSTPKEEKAAPEAPSEEKKVDSEMVRAILFDLRQMGKKAEVKELFEEFGVSKLSEIKEEQYEAVFEAATKIKNAG